MKNGKRFRSAVIYIYLFLCCVYFIWRLLFTLPLEADMTDRVLGSVLVIFEFLAVCQFGMRIRQALLLRESAKSEEHVKAEKDYPEVDIFISAYEKDKHEVFRTVNGCRLLDYPNKESIYITVVDKKERAEIRDMSQKLGFQYAICQGSMEEGLNQALQETDKQYIALLEAGMIPRHEFLLKTVGELMQTDKAGFIQTAMGSFNPDAYQFRLFSEDKIPEENRYFQSVFQPAASCVNATVLCDSNVVVSRKAMEEVHGFSKGMLLTGIRIQEKGYHCLYRNEVLASGIYASDLSTFIGKKRKQIEEAAQIYGNHISLERNQKRSYRAYAGDQLGQVRTCVFLALPIIASLFEIRLWSCHSAFIILAWLGLYLGAELCLRLISGQTTNLRWRRIYEISTFPFLIFSFVRAKLGKYKKQKKNNQLKTLFGNVMAHSIWIAMTLAAGISIIWRFCKGNRDDILVLLLLCLLCNLYMLLMSVFWVIGRPYIRQEERICADISCEVIGSGQKIECWSKDLSPISISVLCDMPYDLDDEEEYVILMHTERYHAQIKGNLVGVQYENGSWKYVFSLIEEEDSKEQYYGILYDRQIQGVEKIAGYTSCFSDIHRNIGRRFKHKTLQYRKMPRIPVNAEIKLVGKDASVYVKNYNYKYLITNIKEKPPQQMILQPMEGILFECEKFHKFGEHTYLYRLMNYEELHNSRDLRDKIYEWVKECLKRNEFVIKDKDMKEEKDIMYI